MNIVNFFASKTFIFLAPLVITFIFILIYKHRKTIHATTILQGLLKRTPFKHYSMIVLLKTFLLVVAFVFLFFALLRPQLPGEKKSITQEGRELFIVLDVSRSMLATDCQPNRLACAKNKIRQLLSSIACERVGLILFSGDAFVQCPLTADYDAFEMFLSHVDAEVISSGTTALDKALGVAMRSFAHVPEKANKIVVIITDGEDFSHNLESVKLQAKKQNISLFAIGVGTAQGAPIPLFDEQGKQIGHQKDSNNNIVISRLNEQVLSGLTQELGGTYLRMQESGDDISRLTSWIHSFERQKFTDKDIEQKQDLYHYFLAGSFICLLLEWIL